MRPLTPFSAKHWSPPDGWERFTVIDSHTGGEPFRVVVDGLPELSGGDVIEMRQDAQARLDRFRRILTWEPRGHADMYGGWLGPAIRPDSDFSVLFVHNEGFSTMCGHGIIALAKVVIDTGMIEATQPETTLRIDTPAGQVVATAEVREKTTGVVRFRNVPSFVVELDATVDVPRFGEVSYDLAFGGAFYAYVDGNEIGLSLADEPAALIDAGRAIKTAISRSRSIAHPESADLGFLYGVIFTGRPSNPSFRHRSVCIFADGELDRSPTGTGVSGSLAILHARGRVQRGEMIRVESIVKSVFGGRIVETTTFGELPAVIPEISGTAHIIGRAELWVDPDDPLAEGFFVR